jgi:hypothetical protein
MPLKNILSALALALLLLVAAPQAQAGPCDSIGNIADRWHKLANFIDENSDEGTLKKAHIPRVLKEARAILPATKTFGDELAKAPANEPALIRLRGIGRQISGLADEITAFNVEDDWDEAVDLIDKLVEQLDKAIEVCNG